MQSKQTSNSEESSSSGSIRIGWGSAIVPLVAVLALGLATKLHADPPRPPVGVERGEQTRAAEPAFGHVADPDRDVGPGEAESILAQHPN